MCENIKRGILLVFCLSCWFIPTICNAADAAFVGVLSLVTDPEGAKALNLSPDVAAKMNALLAERENEALELALEIKSLSPAEQKQKLAPFVAESEKRGLALLTPEQVAKLLQLRIARGGMLTLLEPQVSTSVGLSEAQKAKLQTLATEWEQSSRAAAELDRQAAKAATERKISELLTAEQRAAWEVLAGSPQGEVLVKAVPATESVATVPSQSKSAKEPAASVATDLIAAKTNLANGEEVKLRFSFRYTPWKDVLEWFAQQADLSLVLDVAPPGTFNYSDQRQYTSGEAIDLLNSVLLTKGYTLVRRGRMLLVINLEDGIPPNLVPQVSLKDLASKGEYELVSCLFPLGKFAPEDAEKEIRPLMGPQGALLVLPKAKQIYVTETAGKLRAIHSILQQIEDPTAGIEEKIATFKLKHLLPSELMILARPLLGMPENVNSAPDGSLRVSLDELNGRILATGKAERVAKFSELVTTLDVAEPSELGPATAIETPQLEVYAITTANSDTVLQVLRTLLGGLPDVRLDKDANTGNIVALARPSQHATIRATIDQMQKDTRMVEVVKLRKLDPAMAVVAINKLFGGAEGEASPSGPKVDADPTTLQLLIRGSQSQIEQIRELLSKMGEATSEELAAGTRSNVRMIPLTGRAADSALEQLEALWPTVRSNKIRTVTPSKTPSLHVPLPPASSSEVKKSPLSNSSEAKPSGPAYLEKTTQPCIRSPFEFVAFQKPVDEPTNNASGNTQQAAVEAGPAKPEVEKQKSVPGAEIVVTVGPGGLIIASEDLDALDEFETMLQQISSQHSVSSKEYTVFYLRYAKAEAAVEIIQQAMGGGGGGEEGGGSLMGDLASSFLGGQSGNLLGGLMGLGGGGGSGGSSSGPVTMTPDARLNAIVCYGKPVDLDLVEQLLKVVDQPNSPEDVQTNGKPRFIPVQFADVEEIAATVKQLYASRIAADANQPRQPSPEEFIRALRGGGGGRGGSSTAKKSEEQKMTIGVDKRSNSIIVAAPDPLFQEIELLVKQLDIASSNSDEAVQVVSLKGANPSLVEKALSSLVGENAKVTRQASDSRSSSGTSGASSTPTNRTPNPDQMQDEIRRRVEAFNAMQQEFNRGRDPRGSNSGPPSSSGRRGN
jgi:type II secretory pathway component GspD/PulD (secretin)